MTLNKKLSLPLHLEISILRASTKLGFLSLQILFSLSAYSQADTLWYFQPNLDSPMDYSLIQSSNDSIDGKIEHHFFNSEIVAESYYLVNGKRYGSYRSFYENGILREFYIYSNNIRQGEYTAYNEFGKIIIKGVYKKDLKHGYWALRDENCFGHYKNDEKHGKWKCLDENGELKSRVFYNYGSLLSQDKKKNKEIKKNNTSKKKANPNPSVEANKLDNPRFRDNIYIGQKVYILEVPGGSMDNKTEGKVSQILTKSSFHGLGIKVLLENGKKGRVVEFIDLPSTPH